MKTGLMLQLALPVVLLAGSSEEFFFQYPKKALTEFFESLKAKKTLPKMGHVQHYHVHYYPMPFPLLAWTRAPDKYYLNELYDDAVTSLGWSGYHYGYAPDPSLIMSSGLQHLSEPDLWDDLWDEKSLDTDDSLDTIDRNSKGVLVQVPVNRPLVFHLPLKKSRQRRIEMVTT
ncbi:PREDICTED: uncharacterized protein LOC108763043 [Trachymyrmex cornetzi]|uniref:uncharacterized protein LOC108763043 n=1 Tax=Trachymyrmex cornetzi TaxID=471704 RepID=UPI00084F3257|nr:PREDICTED: uncharacterized protein LOC108763043 [Trachymyrmex cornetzi]XP_018365841.1 PREDICTED: uncharacterized protein LOC108763043 [Trachymyrmex cornetzi]XP_018365842.1 PREDICTED: uncharacterized protein LOC108763043 [Trachymyrmex cornetzi]